MVDLGGGTQYGESDEYWEMLRLKLRIQLIAPNRCAPSTPISKSLTFRLDNIMVITMLDAVLVAQRHAGC